MSALSKVIYVLLVVYTAVSIVYWEGDGLPQLSAGPVSITVFDLLLFFAMVLLVWELTEMGGEGIPRGNGMTLAFIALYCGYQLAVVLPVAVMLHDLDPISVVRSLEDRLSLALVPFVYLVVARRISERQMIGWVNTAALFLVAYALYRYLTVGVVGESDLGVFRVRELWGGATLLFGFLILTVLFLRRPSVWSYLMAVAGLVGMALTNHRSAYLALILTVPPLLISSRRAARRVAVILVVLVLAGGVVSMLAPVVRESVVYTFATMVNPAADTNAQDRVDRSRLGLEYFAANPLGDYTWSGRYYLVDVGPYTFEPHNFVVQLLGQQGIVSFLFFMGVVGAAVLVAWRNRRDRTSAVMLACLCYYLIFCLFNTSLLNTNNVLLLIVPLALILRRNAVLVQAEEGQESAVAAVESDVSLHEAPAQAGWGVSVTR